MTNILRQAQETALYRIIGKAINDYTEKNPLPNYVVIRILANLTVEIINKSDTGIKG